MSYKANRIVIGDIANRQAYLEENPRCEICGKPNNHVHHLIPQQFAINGQVFVLELSINYGNLCLYSCHAISEHNKEQYDREVFGRAFNGRICWKPYEYWHTLRDGSKPEEHVLAWIEQQPRDWFYVTVLEKIEQIIKESKTNER